MSRHRHVTRQSSCHMWQCPVTRHAHVTVSFHRHVTCHSSHVTCHSSHVICHTLWPPIIDVTTYTSTTLILHSTSDICKRKKIRQLLITAAVQYRGTRRRVLLFTVAVISYCVQLLSSHCKAGIFWYSNLLPRIATISCENHFRELWTVLAPPELANARRPLKAKSVLCDLFTC